MCVRDVDDAGRRVAAVSGCVRGDEVEPIRTLRHELVGAEEEEGIGRVAQGEEDEDTEEEENDRKRMAAAREVVSSTHQENVLVLELPYCT